MLKSAETALTNGCPLCLINSSSNSGGKPHQPNIRGKSNQSPPAAINTLVRYPSRRRRCCFVVIVSSEVIRGGNGLLLKSCFRMGGMGMEMTGHDEDEDEPDEEDGMFSLLGLLLLLLLDGDEIKHLICLDF